MNSTLSRELIEGAYARIAPHVRRTPTLDLPLGAMSPSAEVSLKLELLQRTGSFKPRGAFNNALKNNVPAAGLAAASGGNHGIAVAHVAKTLGVPAFIFVPRTASPIKIQAIQALGAHLTLCGESYDEAQSHCLAHASQTGALHVHPFDDESTIAGQGTIGLEWEAQRPDLDAILVAVGGGGLISGIASWYAQTGVRVIGVEPIGASTLHDALKSGEPVTVQVNSIAADSLGPKRVSKRVYDICASEVESVVLVTDDAIGQAQTKLWRDFRLVAEPGGATALAALLCGAFVPKTGSRIGVLLCGSNANLSELSLAPQT